MTDVCMRDGIFLDAGECRKIQPFIASGGHKAAKDVAEKEKQRLESWRQKSLKSAKAATENKRRRFPGVFYNMNPLDDPELDLIEDAISVVYDLFMFSLDD